MGAETAVRRPSGVAQIDTMVGGNTSWYLVITPTRGGSCAVTIELSDRTRKAEIGRRDLRVAVELGRQLCQTSNHHGHFENVGLFHDVDTGSISTGQVSQLIGDITSMLWQNQKHQ